MRRNMNVRVLVLSCLTAATVACLAAAPAGAAMPFPVGLRGGFSIEPDQLVLGAHARVSELVRGWWIVPVAEFGFGDDVTTVALSGDVVYNFPELQTAQWGFYTGAGLGWILYSFDGGDESEIGLNLIGAVLRRLDNADELSLELRIGIDELPDIKVMAGYTFF